MKTEQIRKGFTGLAMMLAVLAVPAQEKQDRKDSFTEERSVGDFTGIKASGPYEVILKQVDANAVKVTADSEEQIKNIKTVVKDGVLEIYPGERVHTSGNSPKIYVSIKSVEKIIIGGACELKSENTITAGKIYVESGGAGDMQLDLNAETVKAELSGASTMKLSGSATSLDAKVHGASTLKAAELETEKATANVSGAATARVNAKSSLGADVSGAATVIYKGDPQDRNVNISGAGSVRQSKSGTGDETGAAEGSDTTKIRWRNKKVLIMDDVLDEVGKNLEKLPEDIRKEIEGELSRNHACGKDCGKNCKHRKHDMHKNHGRNNDEFKHWQGIDLGVNGYLNLKNEIDLPASYEFLALDYARSLHWSLNLFEKDIHLARNYVNLVTGLGFEFNHYAFKNAITLSPSSDPIRAYTDTTIDFRKNKLKTSFVTVPLLLEFNTSNRPRKAFHIAGGITGAYRIGAKTKQVYTAGEYEYKIKKKDDYNLSPFRASATVRAGVGNFTLYANYALTELFEKNKGPKLYPFSLGVNISVD